MTDAKPIVAVTGANKGIGLAIAQPVAPIATAPNRRSLTHDILRKLHGKVFQITPRPRINQPDFMGTAVGDRLPR